MTRSEQLETLLTKVRGMRKAQCAYFANRTLSNLDVSKYAEREVDIMVVNRSTNGRPGQDVIYRSLTPLEGKPDTHSRDVSEFAGEAGDLGSLVWRFTPIDPLDEILPLGKWVEEDDGVRDAYLSARNRGERVFLRILIRSEYQDKDNGTEHYDRWYCRGTPPESAPAKVTEEMVEAAEEVREDFICGNRRRSPAGEMVRAMLEAALGVE